MLPMQSYLYSYEIATLPALYAHLSAPIGFTSATHYHLIIYKARQPRALSIFCAVECPGSRQFLDLSRGQFYENLNFTAIL